ncbi:N-acetylmuramoyl-L-alanine amidase family protein [Pseudobacteroides cellulosolvens]|uniref:Cell wall hydrolase/autolysin n=1 Tax=Pseudobacteroides cellulosolvens ATCC 35603 = DSM 2933 TaxID=398512 RepID=A0A0L6JRF3_9FIRM|nr:N-acetylmuramoyl-L-alanine amidase family protein [Pseudobacteroides cellulosolvens]KNY28255.1 cell wall hydrolase/autolysin [Pseudobacteroides cellulosolvens ATCC 35603 = DSM 2933]
MRKIGSVLLSSAISLAMVSTSFSADPGLTSEKTVHNTQENINIKVNGVSVKSDVSPVIKDNRTLVPARAVFEQLGAKITWDEKNRQVGVTLGEDKILLTINNKKASVNNKNVEMDVPAQILNNRTLVPLRFVGEQLNMNVSWNAAQKLVTVDNKKNGNEMAKLDNIVYTPEGKNDKVTLHITNYSDYNIFKIDDPNKNRIVVDLPNTSMTIKNKINIKSAQIKAIRYSQFEEKVARVVLDVNDKAQYKVEKLPDKLVLNILGTGISGRGDVDRDETPTVGATPKFTPTPLQTPTLTPTNTPVPTTTYTPTPSVTEKPSGSAESTETPPPDSEDIGGLDVKFSIENSKEKVIIDAESYQGYNITRFTEPDRIAVDIPNAKTSKDQQTVNVNGKYIKKIRYAMFDDKTARVVLDVTGQVQFKSDIEDGKLVVRVDPPVFRNIKYSNMGDRVGLTISGATLTEGGENLKKLYSGSYGENNTVYTITFPSGQANLDTGIMYIDDKYLKTIEIKKDSSQNTTSIVFSANEKFVYQVFSRSNLNDTAITILKPAVPGEKLVVIDPGHGGSEPGAESFGTVEKTFNLDISIRLDKLLKQAGIRSYIIREEDAYIGLYERAYIANDLNATLFLSIHNNAFHSREKGTETLYYPNRSNSKGFTSKRFAQLIQDNLVGSLHTKNRGLVERPNLVVLKATKMPAALAEVAFMTNKDDFALLQSESFRQKTAEALYKSIVQSLSEI